MQGNIRRHITLLLSGTLGAQLISITFTPIITRLYGPDAFGLFGTVMAAVAIVSPLVTLGYPAAISLPKKDAEAKELTVLALVITIAISLIIAIFLLLERTWFIKIFNIKVHEISVLLLIPVLILFASCLDISQQWMVRKKAFSITAQITISNSLLLNIFKLAIGTFYPSAIALLLATAFATGIQSFGLQWRLHRKYPLILKDKITFSLKSATKLAKKYLDFPAYRTPQLTLLTLSQNLPALMLAYASGPTAAGFYTLARISMAAPTILLGKSVGDVLYSHINEKSQLGENITSLIIKPTVILAITGFLPFTILFYFGPSVFSLVFGHEWSGAGEYARWLGIFFYFSLVSKPAFAAVPALGMQKNIFFSEIISTFAKTGGILIGLYLFSDDVLAIMFFSIIGAVSNLIIIKWVFAKSGYC